MRYQTFGLFLDKNDPYGTQSQAADPLGNPYRYTSREWDGGPGLNYHRARYYDPTLGRFLSKDPWGMVDGPNLYAYAGNNPVRYADPTGNRPLDEGLPDDFVPPGPVPSSGSFSNAAALPGLSPPGPTSLSRSTSPECLLQYGLTALSVTLAFIGIILPIRPDIIMASFAARTMLWSLGAQIYQEHPNPARLFFLIFGIGWWLFWAVFWNTLGFWAKLGISAMVAARYASAAQLISIAMVGVVFGVGVVGLINAGCVG